MVDTHGRGAWTKFGKDNNSIYYEVIRSLPRDGSSPEKGLDYQAVHLGVKSIQQRLVDLGLDSFKTPFVIDGIYNARTARMIKRYQRANGLPISGLVGATTGSHLFGRYIAEAGLAFKWNSDFVYGIMRQESAGDPGAVGWFTPGDRGLFQFNTLVHDITYEQAHDFVEATERVMARFDNAWAKYKGKGEELRVNCSIAQHNAPTWADQWFANGFPPNETIEKYVGNVRGFAASAP